MADSYWYIFYDPDYGNCENCPLQIEVLITHEKISWEKTRSAVGLPR